MKNHEKIKTDLSLSKELLERIREKAKLHDQSINDYVEILLLRDIWNIPNAETIAAIEEAHRGVKLETITDIEKFMDSI